MEQVEATSGEISNMPIIDKRSVREQVYDYLREAILNGIYEPGDKLVESRLAKKLHISRTPIREALPILEDEGLIEPGYNGYVVLPMSWQDVEEICAMRIANETLAASWALKRITKKEIDELEKNLRTAEAEMKKGNTKVFAQLDAAFHEVIYQASGSKRIFKICEMLRRHMLRYRIKSFFNMTDMNEAQKVLDGHWQIIEKLKAGDEDELRKAIVQHIEESKNIIKFHFS